MADEKQLAILGQGVDVWNKWRENNSSIPIKLTGADLRNVKISGANLERVDLSKANISGALLEREPCLVMLILLELILVKRSS
jgi:hypothetical protein